MAEAQFIHHPMPDDLIGEFHPKGLESYHLLINGAYAKDLLSSGDSDLLAEELDKVLRSNPLSYHVPNRGAKEIKFTGAPVDVSLGGNLRGLTIDDQRWVLERISQIVLSYDFKAVEYRDPANPRRKIEVSAEPTELDTTF